MNTTDSRSGCIAGGLKPFGMILLAAVFLGVFGLGDAYARGGGGRGGGGFNRSQSFGGGGNRQADFNRQGQVNRSAQFEGAQPARGNIGQVNRNVAAGNTNINRTVNNTTVVNNTAIANRPGYPPPPMPVPVPVPVPAYGYSGGYGAGVAAGVAAGAMLTVLPATAIALSNSSSSKGNVYVVDQKCYREVYSQGSVAYQPIPCP
ncbi:MAG: hypothetical protein HY795_18955 [Desulfovibrio sp.]|nr:hypothetical protein [Desulfovibrio sp.]MBI4959580.1 hypothetical protein [Desulfovibrio sp.]